LEEKTEETGELEELLAVLKNWLNCAESCGSLTFIFEPFPPPPIPFTCTVTVRPLKEKNECSDDLRNSSLRGKKLFKVTAPMVEWVARREPSGLLNTLRIPSPTIRLITGW